MSALAQSVLVRCLVTVMLGREFHAPGTEISVSAGDAARLVQIGAAAVVDEPEEEQLEEEEPEEEELEEDEQESDASEPPNPPDPAAGETTPPAPIVAVEGTRRGRRR